jgi:hypothetical protein
MVQCIGICHGRRKKVMSTATSYATQAWPLEKLLIIYFSACLLDDSAGSGRASRQAWLSLAKVTSRSIDALSFVVLMSSTLGSSNMRDETFMGSGCETVRREWRQ